MKRKSFLKQIFLGNYWYIYISSVKLVSYIYLRCNKKFFILEKSKTLFITQNQILFLIFYSIPPPVKKIKDSLGFV